MGRQEAGCAAAQSAAARVPVVVEKLSDFDKEYTLLFPEANLRIKGQKSNAWQQVCV